MSNRQIFAFVLMPFAAKFDDIYKLGIKEAAAQVGVRAERLDEQIFVEGMLERIYRQIDIADIVIADMSEKNPNVFYEVGYAHAKSKLCILQTSDAGDIPFDLKHRRHIVYRDSISYLKEELTKNLKWAKTEIENSRRSQIRVEFRRPDGDLKVGDFLATATIKFRVDLHNDSDRPSSEISAIYFYAGNPWAVTQENRECPSTRADVADYKHRYFLTPPVSKLQGQGWAQLHFTATRTIANALDGDELKSSYPVQGRTMLRFVTNNGAFDYKYDVDLKVTEIPF